MNYSFSLSHNNLVVETHWSGELTGEILSKGVVSHNNWVLTKSDKLPLVLLFDFTKATLSKVSENDLQGITSLFSGIEDIFPGVNWICIMPKGAQYSIVRMWLEHAEKICNNSHIVNSRHNAAKIVSDILTSYIEA